MLLQPSQAPSPRLEAVSGQLLGGHIVVFGGSTTANDATCHDVYTLNPDEAQPRWRKLAVLGIAPERGWGFSACTVGGSKVRQISCTLIRTHFCPCDFSFYGFVVLFLVSFTATHINAMLFC
jgi:hypothetical protein